MNVKSELQESRKVAVRDLAELLATRGDHAGAAALLRRELTRAEASHGKGGGKEGAKAVAAAAEALAEALRAAGDVAGAAPLLRKALDARERAHGREHAETKAVAARLCTALEDLGDDAAAMEVEEAYDV